MATPSQPVFTISVIVLLGLTFCMWTVSLAGIASLQAICDDNKIGTSINAGFLNGIRGFSAKALPCTSVFGYYWWIIALEFALLAGLAMSVVAGCAAKARATWVGLFAVASCLYIQMTDSFLAIQGLTAYDHGLALDRARNMGAGCVAVAVLNLLLIIALGSDFDDVSNCKLPTDTNENGGRQGAAYATA